MLLQVDAHITQARPNSIHELVRLTRTIVDDMQDNQTRLKRVGQPASGVENPPRGLRVVDRAENHLSHRIASRAKPAPPEDLTGP